MIKSVILITIPDGMKVIIAKGLSSQDAAIIRREYLQNEEFF